MLVKLQLDFLVDTQRHKVRSSVEEKVKPHSLHRRLEQMETRRVSEEQGWHSLAFASGYH